MANSIFNDVSDNQIKPTGDVGLESMPNIGSIKIGSGAKAFKADESGIWLGGNKFADAPFSVDMDGNIVATTLSLSDYLSKTDAAQELTGDIRVGTGSSIKLDGANHRITINDGTNDIILIGLYP